jgi:hypothetical protein
MAYPHSKPEVRTRIKSIVIKEFGGIDHLPDKMFNLLKILAEVSYRRHSNPVKRWYGDGICACWGIRDGQQRRRGGFRPSAV